MSRLLLLACAAVALPVAVNGCSGSTEPPRVATTVIVAPGSWSFTALGATQQFTAVVKDQHGDTLVGAGVTWSSGNSATVSINASSGLATAVAPGTAVVTATSGTATQTANVTVTQVPAQITKVSGDAQTGTVGLALAQPVVVQVNDANAHAIAGITVNFTMVAGAGGLGTAAATTNASGQAQTTWTLGQIAGTNHQVSATPTSGTAGAVNFTATANAATAASIGLLSGNGQSGQVATALGSAIVVRVADQFNNPVAGTTVTFAVTGGGGSVNPTSAASNATGLSQTTWTLGQTAGAQTMTVTVAGLTGSPVSFSSFAAAGASASVTKSAGDAQTASAGTPVATAPTVVVKDAFNNLKQGAIVTFAIASGGGSLVKPIDTTDASGVASVGSWILGAAGANTMTATVAGVTAVTFTATANPVGGAANAVAFVGDNQTGLVGFAVNIRPAVRVTDAGGGPVPNVSVTFAVASGGGSVTSATVNTSSNGVAQVGSWVLGGPAGANTVTATATGAGIAGNPVTFSATGATPTFTITIQNVGPTAFTPAVQAAFDSAAALWQRVIFQDIPDIPNFSVPAAQCDGWLPAVGPVTVDDVLILTRMDSTLDGPGGLLGRAGPCYIRTTGRLTIMGRMIFDAADVASLAASGQLNDVIRHEMGHVLGFGTLWDQTQFNCLKNASSVGNPLDTYFDCAKGLAMFDSIGGTSYTGGSKVPVENCGPQSPGGCGAGQLNGHWREPVFGLELMTPYLTVGAANPFSRLSAAAMEDLGYVVNYAGSQTYSQTFSLMAAGARGASVISFGDDIARGPIYVMDPRGRVVGVIAPVR
jgi:hypothetical protein